MIAIGGIRIHEGAWPTANSVIDYSTHALPASLSFPG
jgi:hypothetical protein